MKRTCPIPGCGAGLRAGHLMCGGCWRRVPRRLQTAVNQSWARYQDARRPGNAEALSAARGNYEAAAAGAIGAVEASRP